MLIFLKLLFDTLKYLHYFYSLVFETCVQHLKNIVLIFIFHVLVLETCFQRLEVLPVPKLIHVKCWTFNVQKTQHAFMLRLTIQLSSQASIYWKLKLIYACIFILSKFIFFTKTATSNSYLVHFILRCSKIELELTKVSKLSTQYLINEIVYQKFNLMID